MPWSTEGNGGFSNAPEGRLWLPVSAEIGTIDVATQLGDPSSSLSLYRRLLALRRRSPALTIGTYRRLGAGEPSAGFSADTWMYERAWVTDRKLIALNTSAREQRVPVEDSGVVEISTAPHREGTPVYGELHLLPDEAVVIDVGMTR
jgi:glycosidase